MCMYVEKPSTKSHEGGTFFIQKYRGHFLIGASVVWSLFYGSSRHFYFCLSNFPDYQAIFQIAMKFIVLNSFGEL
jgi:hypothetical protein